MPHVSLNILPDAEIAARLARDLIERFLPSSPVAP